MPGPYGNLGSRLRGSVQRDRMSTEGDEQRLSERSVWTPSHFLDFVGLSLSAVPQQPHLFSPSALGVWLRWASRPCWHGCSWGGIGKTSSRGKANTTAMLGVALTAASFSSLRRPRGPPLTPEAVKCEEARGELCYWDVSNTREKGVENVSYTCNIAIYSPY